jgi:hypothetical protein
MSLVFADTFYYLAFLNDSDFRHKQQGIMEALTGDHCFEQAGFVALLKGPPRAGRAPPHNQRVPSILRK